MAKAKKRVRKQPKLRWKSAKEYVPLYPLVDHREMWSLDECIRLFILPRLKAFAKLQGGHPCSLTAARWRRIIGEMVYGFEFAGDDWVFEEPLFSRLERESKTIRGGVLNHPEVKKAQKRAERGRHLFAEWFGGLWT